MKTPAVKGLFAAAAAVVLAAAAATVSAASESTKRSMSIVSVDDENVTVALSAFNAPQRLFWCYGQFDRKADLNAWEHREFVGNVGTESTNVTVKLPVGWGSSVSCLRFVLVEQSEFDEEFEYVTAGGTYIDTGVNDNEIRPKVEVKWSPMADGNANNPEAMFASGFSPGCIQFWSHVLRMGGGSHSELVVGGQVYVDFADTRSYTITRNGVPYPATSGAYSYSPAIANFLLFARQGSSGGTSNAISARFYSCKIWDARENGDVLVRDFVPCRQGGVVQLYDRVTKMMYKPGKGELLAGPAAIPQAEAISDLVAVNGWREVCVVGGIYSGGKLKSVRLAFGPGMYDEVLYVGYGAKDCGQVISSWPHARRVKEIARGKTQCSVDVPADWGESITHMRFFLGKEQPSPVETEWEYVDYVSGTLHVLVAAKDAPRPIVEFKWRPLVESSSATRIALASCKDGVGGSGTGIQVFSSYLRMGADNKQAAEVTTVKDADYTDVFDNVALTVSRNGEMLSPSSSPSFATFANGEDFSVFSRYGQYLYPSRFYSLKIWSGLDGVLRHYCVPGMKDGEAVVYDKVTKNVCGRTGGTSDSLVVGGASVTSEDVYNPLSFTDVVECTQKLPNVAGMMVIIK